MYSFSFRLMLGSTLVVAALSACSGGATVGSTPSGGTATAAGATPTPSSTASGAVPTATASATATGATPAPTPTSTPTGSASSTATTKIYVVNRTKNGSTGQTPSITIYPTTASGNVAPIATISGSLTGLDIPQFIAIDGSGNIWVTNEGSNTVGSVEEFAAGASGNVAPIATITGFDAPEGIFVDAAGDVYVATTNYIYEYAPGTTGANPTPMRAIGAPANTAIAGPYGIRVSSAGQIYVAQEEAIYVFAAGANGNVAPSQTIEGMASLFGSDLDVAIDASLNIYCTNFNLNTINEYAPTATGDAAPSATITSTSLNQPIGLAFDATYKFYVANYGNNSVAIFPAGTTGSGVATVISGSNTGINSPYGIAVH